MAVLDMCDKISESIDQDKYSIGTFIDLSKAFDTINHKILIRKLELYGIRGTPLLWFTNYLENRCQYVSINNTASTTNKISSGVPQGSILGPLLFLLNINDIVNCSSLLKFIIFADDTNLFHSAKNITQLVLEVNQELTNLNSWFQANKLSLNSDKTKFILFGKKWSKINTNYITIK